MEQPIADNEKWWLVAISQIYITRLASACVVSHDLRERAGFFLWRRSLRGLSTSRRFCLLVVWESATLSGSFANRSTSCCLTEVREMKTHCDLYVAPAHNGFVIRVQGRGTSAHSPALANFVRGCFEQDSQACVAMDLLGCQYLDSTFLGCLLNLQRDGTKRRF